MEFSQTSIIIAIDDANSAGRALDYGLEMAETLKLPVRLVHVARSQEDHGADVRRLKLDEIQNAANGIPEYELGAALLDRALERAGERQVEVEPGTARRRTRSMRCCATWKTATVRCCSSAAAVVEPSSRCCWAASAMH